MRDFIPGIGPPPTPLVILPVVTRLTALPSPKVAGRVGAFSFSYSLCIFAMMPPTADTLCNPVLGARGVWGGFRLCVLHRLPPTGPSIFFLVHELRHLVRAIISEPCPPFEVPLLVLRLLYPKGGRFRPLSHSQVSKTDCRGMVVELLSVKLNDGTVIRGQVRSLTGVRRPCPSYKRVLASNDNPTK